MTGVSGHSVEFRTLHVAYLLAAGAAKELGGGPNCRGIQEGAAAGRKCENPHLLIHLPLYLLLLLDSASSLKQRPSIQHFSCY